jgi:hypothetical protein
VAFRPQRLALHELLVRVTADFSIPDGAKIEDLGINFRRTVATILRTTSSPSRRGSMQAYEVLRRALAAAIEKELAVLYPAAPESPERRRRRPRAACARCFTVNARPRRTSLPPPTARARHCRLGGDGA